MQELMKTVIATAALAAGLPEGRVIELVKKDNLTLPRPRLEIQFLPERLTRTGRLLGITRNGSQQTRKTELYTAQYQAGANVLADDRAWLESFCPRFIALLPRGVNDANGNWVRIRPETAEFGKPPDKRVGDAVIEVFTKINRYFLITFTGRITVEETEGLIPTIKLNPHLGGKNHGDEKD